MILPNGVSVTIPVKAIEFTERNPTSYVLVVGDFWSSHSMKWALWHFETESEVCAKDVALLKAGKVVRFEGKICDTCRAKGNGPLDCHDRGRYAASVDS